MTTLSRSSDVLSADAMDGSVLLNAESWVYLSLNPTAAWVWESLAEPRSPDWLVTAARQRFEAPEGAIEADVNAFIADLVTRGFVVAH